MAERERKYKRRGKPDSGRVEREREREKERVTKKHIVTRKRNIECRKDRKIGILKERKERRRREIDR